MTDHADNLCGLHVRNGVPMYLTCRDSDVLFQWFDMGGGDYHPISGGTIRCHARLDDPEGPRFTVEGDEVYTVPGRYCRNGFVCKHHEEDGMQWRKQLIGRFVPLTPDSGGIVSK